MKTQKAVETHNAIVNAAKELFMEKSVNKVSVSEIVKRAGVAKGTFYLYFETKEALVWHFIEHEFDGSNKWITNIVSKGYEVEDINAITEYIIDFVKKHFRVLKMMHNIQFYGFLGSDNMKRNYIERWIKPIYIWLEKGKMLGKIDIDDSLFMARYLLYSIHEIIDRIITGDLDYSLDELELHLKALLLKLLK